MSNEIEKDYDTYCEEINQKVEEATRLLREAKEAAVKAGINLVDHDYWQDLRDVTDPFFNGKSWDSSNWCGGDDSWNDSGCSI
jgi:hypothetical protein